MFAGTIEEKIYQRQLQKSELADAMQRGGGGAGGKAKEGRFTREELRQLFQLNGATACDTRDLLQSTPAGAQWQVQHSHFKLSAGGVHDPCSTTPSPKDLLPAL